MPNRGHRTAVRQAQLRNRRRRGKRRQQFDPGPSESDAPSAAPVTASAAAQAAAAPAPPTARASRSTRRARLAAQDQPLLTNPFLGMEFKQIGLITSLIVAIIIVLTFVLG